MKKVSLYWNEDTKVVLDKNNKYLFSCNDLSESVALYNPDKVKVTWLGIDLLKCELSNDVLCCDKLTPTKAVVERTSVGDVCKTTSTITFEPSCTNEGKDPVSILQGNGLNIADARITEQMCCGGICRTTTIVIKEYF